MGVDDGILQQRIHGLARQGEELRQMEIELRAQLIAKSEILKMQNNFEVQLKEQANIAAKLKEQIGERDQTVNELERKLEDQDRELHDVRLANEAAWAKEDLLREQTNELANFRMERDSIETERAHHMKQIHDLQEHVKEKERQLLELEEQHRVDKETILFKDEQLRDAQAWMTRVQEIDGLQSNTLQAELRERTEQYNQLWLLCQRQFAEMERVHMQTIQQLQLELAGARERNGTHNSESNISQDSSSGGSQSHVLPYGGNFVDPKGPSNVGSGPLPNGHLESPQAFVSSGDTVAQNNHAPTLPFALPSILGMPSYLPTGQMAALHPYVMHQQGPNHSVPSHVTQNHVNQFPTASLHQWQNQQAVSESPPVPCQSEFSVPQNNEIPSRSDSSYSYEFSVNGPGLHSDYLNAHMSSKLDPGSQVSSAEEAQILESVEKSYQVTHEAQHSLQDISSQLNEVLCLEPLDQTSEIKAQENDDINITNDGLECCDVLAEQKSSSSTPASVHPVHFAEATANNTADCSLGDNFVPAVQKNSFKGPETVLLDERALLACIARTIPPGGKIRISSTLPNRLGKMLAPLHWHDYKRKYGKLDDFVASHLELFVIDGDYIQLQEGAQGIIAATAAVAKVAAAAVASSPRSSLFPSVAVTPIAHSSRGQSVTVSAQNGVHSDRSGIGNLQPKGPTHARAGVSFVGKQPGRTSSVQMESRQ